MGFVRVEVRVYVQGAKRPVLKMTFDETTLGQLNEVVNFVQSIPFLKR